MLKILRPQENVMPDGILARLKSPFPYWWGIKNSFIRYQGDNASLGKPKNGEKNPVSCHFFLRHLKKMIVTICIWKNEKIRPF